MTPLKLQDYFVGSKNRDGRFSGGLLEYILKDLRTIDGEKPWNIYDNSPDQRKDKGDISIYPYCFSVLGDGEDNGETAKQQVIIVAATYNIDVSYSGYRDVMNALERIREYLMKYPNGNDEILKNQEGSFFEVLKPIKWVSPEQSSNSPVFIGGLELNIQLPAIGRMIPYI